MVRDSQNSLVFLRFPTIPENSQKNTMHSQTLEEYKKAIKSKYEIEKEGEYFDYLYNPSRAKLRDLCWIIFENNPTQDDLNVFRNLLCLDFDHTRKNKFNEQKDKFRPIETFFKGETDPSNIDAINLAAILIDFQPRPFKKYNEKCRINDVKHMISVVEINAAAEVEIIEEGNLVESYPEKGNRFYNFKYVLSRKIVKKIYPRKIITATVGAVAFVSSARLYFVRKKDQTE
ncbi:hypothetical protein [Flavobacterium sp. N502540]|uniref:hypothetical protein n=1 Tax=Flavobacterium sp. N502540 TaxID=2986838 RepID=UPI00222512BF|nr:hypothetical protein [Flavobacterium sp. N502540]